MLEQSLASRKISPRAIKASVFIDQHTYPNDSKISVAQIADGAPVNAM